MAKIQQIEFKNHPLFGDAKFDFLEPDGTPADTIVFAGENGSGKTRLMEELYFGLRQNYNRKAPIRDFRQTIITLDNNVKLTTSSDEGNPETFYHVDGAETFVLSPAYSTTEINFTSDEIPDILKLARFTDAFYYMFEGRLKFKNVRDARRKPRAQKLDFQGKICYNKGMSPRNQGFTFSKNRATIEPL